MLDKTIEATAVNLQARHGMSGGRAVVKAEGTVVGKLAAGAGALLMFVAAGLALAVILKGANSNAVPFCQRAVRECVERGSHPLQR